MKTSIIVCTHSSMAEGARSAVEMICGPQEDFYAVGFEDGGDMMRLIRTLEDIVTEQTVAGKQVLVFTDLYGATPFNSAAAAMAKLDAAIITGVNLPMLLETAVSRADGESAAALADAAEEAGRSGIRKVEMNEMFKNINKGD